MSLSTFLETTKLSWKAFHFQNGIPTLASNGFPTIVLWTEDKRPVFTKPSPTVGDWVLVYARQDQTCSHFVYCLESEKEAFLSELEKHLTPEQRKNLIPKRR